MHADTEPGSQGDATSIAAAGAVALAIAMGIGRFAFTPIFPLMQHDMGLDVRAGAWLATANYAGYFVGSLAAIWLRMPTIPTVASSLAAVAFATALMAVTDSFGAWVVLRFAAGAASAFVLVFVSAWALEQLAHLGEGRLRGVVFSGVGAGIACSGVLCWLVDLASAGSRTAWLLLAVAALAGGAGVYRAMVAAPANPSRPRLARVPAGREFWRLVVCYGAFGFAYIVPATFLPVMAKSFLGDSAAAAFTWPLFGGAAAASTVLAARGHASMTPRSLWRVSNVLMAAGLVAVAGSENAVGIATAAVCVGGTFMVITMAGMQEARRVGGPHAQPYIAAMTTAFAAGQILGPLAIGLMPQSAHPFQVSMIAAAALLLGATWALGGNQSSESA